MTIERKIVVGLEDIQALTFECGKCGARVTMQPDRAREIPAECVQCHQEWISFNPTNREPDTATDTTVRFWTALQTVRVLIKNNKLGFKILLEFREPRWNED
jgi:hypothetical protein